MRWSRSPRQHAETMAKSKSQLQLFKGRGKDDDSLPPPPIEDAALADETQRR